MARIRVTRELASERSTRERILDAAETLFARRGYAGIGLAEVAEWVGIGKSSLFHHFRSKPELYAAVVARILERIAERATRSLAGGGDPVERLERLLDDLVDVLASDRRYARLLLRAVFEDDDLPGTSPDELAAQRTLGTLIGSLGALLREGMTGGPFRADSVPHVILTLVGALVFPFASGEFGTEVVGADPFAPAEVDRRKRALRELVRFGLVTHGRD